MHKRLLRDGRPTVWAAMMAMTASVASAGSAAGYTPDSPEVRRAVDRAIGFLESADGTDSRVGAKALAGLVLVKRGTGPDHPRIVEAVKAIRRALESGDASKINLDIYSTGLSVIFLVDLDPREYAPEIKLLMESLWVRQKPHGGWGYPALETGDTSMTQYGVLSCWEAMQAGIPVPIQSVEKVATWLLRTQDPSGAFGYQGTLSSSFQPVKQSSIRHSMVAAGLGSVYICADMLGVAPRVEQEPDEDLPPALKRVQQAEPSKRPAEVKTRLDPRLFQAAEARGNAWMQANYRIDPPRYIHYYLYALERYMSFRELAEGKLGKEGSKEGPGWYNDGVRYLFESQAEDGSWNSNSKNVGQTCDTAFGALFLMRSTRKSIQKARNFGDGTLVGGRGLPKQTDRARVRDGKVVAKPLLGPAEQLLEALESAEAPKFGETVDLLVDLPPQEAEALMEKHGARLRRLAGDRSPEARMAAVRTLSKTRNVDNVPTLIYALTDPDPTIVKEARDGLRRISRNPAGFGLSDKPAESELGAVIEKWKAWYLAIRPDAEFEN